MYPVTPVTKILVMVEVIEMKLNVLLLEGEEKWW
jgi:hypothetical protein